MHKIKPFINWAGGKSQLLAKMSLYFPNKNEYKRYIEPFVGGGILFLTLQLNKAILGDSNEELINCYQVIRDDVDILIKLLSNHISNKEYYYKMREKDPKKMDRPSRAARFIYLNKTCYNGVYRVNSRGQFNVPYGSRKAKIYDEENLYRINKLLKNVIILPQSYKKTLELAEQSDFIYLDPPYYPVSKTANFTKYTRIPFGKEDQIKLAKEFDRLTLLGCKVMLSNSDTLFIRELYRKYHLKILKANRYVNCDGNGRKAITELLITNYHS